MAATQLTRVLKTGCVGKDVEGATRALLRYLGDDAGWRSFVAALPVVRRTFGPGKKRLTMRAQARLGIGATGEIGTLTETKLRQARAFDLKADALLDEYAAAHQPKPTPLPDLGPIVRGGASVLAHDLTHATAGIPLYPAYDDAFNEGATIIAPETMTVTRQSSSVPGAAFYATGASGLRYWFGHLASAPPTGKRFGKGEAVSRVGPNTVGGGPHCHLGINVEELWGAGQQFAHRTDYRHGSPLVGAQLKSGTK